MSYNKDLQFDKTALFGTVDDASAMLRLAARAVEGLDVRMERAATLAAAGHANATDVADLLVAAGVPFREAHERVGGVVRAAIDDETTIDGLADDRLRDLLPELEPVAIRALTVEAMLANRDVPGGTAPGRVRDAVESASGRL